MTLAVLSGLYNKLSQIEIKVVYFQYMMITSFWQEEN